ncbi:hypothetical protein MLD38_030293 [Melastoma candidum]|uniref:Uncharacterized protein n=1 Tax=Melastoma candidum TaxID=119954 RepID=A0ACB9MPT7_9MYRT|nr:hypothetical protein MLD38_030293 [Melastoma candidum]
MPAPSVMSIFSTFPLFQPKHWINVPSVSPTILRTRRMPSSPSRTVVSAYASSPRPRNAPEATPWCPSTILGMDHSRIVPRGIRHTPQCICQRTRGRRIGVTEFKRSVSEIMF